MEKSNITSLTHDENLYSLLVEQSQDAIYLLCRGKFRYINHKFSEIFQITLEEANAPGFDFFRLIAPESHSFIRERLDKVARGERVEPRYKFTALTKDGRRILVDASVSYIPYKGDVAVHGVLRDITERRRLDGKLQETKRQQKAILDNIPDIAWLKDRESRYIAVNEPFGKACGVKPEYITGMTDLELWPIDLAKKYKDDDKSVMQCGKRRRIAELLVRKDGKELWVETVKTPIYDERGDIIGIAGIARDITEQKTAHERLARINDCFLRFVADPLDNIRRLTSLFGEIMDATCALYNRLEKGALCSIGQWNTPPGFNPVDGPDGHICYDLIRSKSDSPFIVRNLHQTSYVQTDPNVAKYELRTYVGQKVKCGGVPVGSICAVYQRDISPSENDIKVMGIIASAISIEEEKHRGEEVLKQREKELLIKSCNLEEVNTALKVLLKHRDKEMEEFKKRVLSNVKKLINPYVKKLKKSGLNTDQIMYTDILENNLDEIISPFLHNLSAKYMNFTPQEIQVANLVKEGKTTKDIAQILNVTRRTVAFHRENIRNKLKLNNKKTNLRSYLLAIS
ncbi:MAG TPA: PAS domain S-box protein [Syntrophales bacterium]|nr:PAS domain S-box protein [Syntrophales bacterium]